MMIWKRGRRIYRERIAATAPSFEAFLAELDGKLAARIPGSAIFLAGPMTGVPTVLLQHVERIRALPESVLLLHDRHHPLPLREPRSGRMRLEELR